ncbi:hypothetical protein SAMN06265375_1122 [Muriicola jejuensis]|uniref:Uncharacterized protein n=1 Tax=Muriicola jejuensis TaxID=504488 RepID=A0A6P0UL43_9FLAO|nr:hypothetical protein [Muriicola jejuensis]NER11773.1 hypothetical protein [Muriicola jejuensis]SMP27108.1 hypothetical protein SAMN06265375_1122 [Muriicola jejuensis]
MSTPLLSTFLIFFSLYFNQNHKYFPEKSDVLNPDYVSYENFFPIATLDLTSQGIEDKIHIVFTSFDPDIDHNEPFPEGDYIDNYSFAIESDGLLKPTFKESALEIGNGYMKYFIEGKSKFNESKSQLTTSILRFYKYPEWLQFDQTPKNSRGENMKFICQADIYKVFNDDCWLYVFYDESDRKVKIILQRD